MTDQEKLIARMNAYLLESHNLMKQWKDERKQYGPLKVYIKIALNAVLTKTQAEYLPLVKKVLRELK